MLGQPRGQDAQLGVGAIYSSEDPMPPRKGRQSGGVNEATPDRRNPRLRCRRLRRRKLKNLKYHSKINVTWRTPLPPSNSRVSIRLCSLMFQ